MGAGEECGLYGLQPRAATCDSVQATDAPERLPLFVDEVCRQRRTEPRRREGMTGFERVSQTVGKSLRISATSSPVTTMIDARVSGRVEAMYSITSVPLILGRTMSRMIAS